MTNDTNDRGERTVTVTLTWKVVGAAIVAFFIIAGLGIAGMVTTNSRSVDQGKKTEATLHETQLLGKCVFNLLAYRAYLAGLQGTASGQTNTGLPPYADLKLPKDIRHIKLAPCQKYLTRIPESVKKELTKHRS